jgi:hypothetical protein
MDMDMDMHNHMLHDHMRSPPYAPLPNLPNHVPDVSAR